MIRHLIPAAGIVIAASSLSGAPASADEPFVFTDATQFTEPDPCDPTSDQTTSLELEVSLHSHRNNQVINVVIDATTSSGFSGSGHQTVVAGPRTYNETTQVVLTNPDTSERYKVNGHLTARADGVVVDDFSITCLR